MKTNILRAAVFAFAVIGAGCAMPNNTTNDNSHAGMNHNNMPANQGMNSETMNHATMPSSPNAASAPYDLQFLDTMIAHHQGAVTMAGPVAAKAQHAEIKTLAANIISSQQTEKIGRAHV